VTVVAQAVQSLLKKTWDLSCGKIRRKNQAFILELCGKLYVFLSLIPAFIFNWTICLSPHAMILLRQGISLPSQLSSEEMSKKKISARCRDDTFFQHRSK